MSTEHPIKTANTLNHQTLALYKKKKITHLNHVVWFLFEKLVIVTSGLSRPWFKNKRPNNLIHSSILDFRQSLRNLEEAWQKEKSTSASLTDAATAVSGVSLFSLLTLQWLLKNPAAKQEENSGLIFIQLQFILWLLSNNKNPKSRAAAALEKQNRTNSVNLESCTKKPTHRLTAGKWILRFFFNRGK